MTQHDLSTAKADQARGLHILLFFFHHRGAANGTREGNPFGKTDGDDQHRDRNFVTQMGRQQAPGNPENQHRNQDRREGYLNIGGAHDHGIDPSAAVSGDKAQADAQHHGQDYGGQPDKKRYPKPKDNRREQIAALVVSAEHKDLPSEDVGLHRRGEPVHEIERRRIKGIGRRHQIGKNCQQNQHHYNHERDDRHGRALEVIEKIALANAGHQGLFGAHVLWRLSCPSRIRGSIAR